MKALILVLVVSFAVSGCQMFRKKAPEPEDNSLESVLRPAAEPKPATPTPKPAPAPKPAS